MSVGTSTLRDARQDAARRDDERVVTLKMNCASGCYSRRDPLHDEAQQNVEK